MTYEEAKVKVTNDCSLCYLNEEQEMCDYECVRFKGALLEALNKQIPKHTIQGHCPCCGFELDVWMWCPVCGQKLDWSGEE